MSPIPAQPARCRPGKGRARTSRLLSLVACAGVNGCLCTPASDAGPDASAPAPLSGLQDPDVRGRIGLLGDQVVVTKTDFGRSTSEALANVKGVVAYDRRTLDLVWERHGIPGVSLVGEDTVYAYGRGGLVVALDERGHDRWRAAVPDDRSEVHRSMGKLGCELQPDLAEVESTLYVPAQAEVLALSRETGAVLSRARVCRSPRGVVARLAASSRGVRVTCTVRSSWDDAPFPNGPWDPGPFPPFRRLDGGALVGLTLDLQERFRIDLSARGLAPLDGLPVIYEDGRVALMAGALTEVDGIRSLSHESVLLMLDERTGEVLWEQREQGLSDGEGAWDLGLDLIWTDALTVYDALDGSPRWQLREALRGVEAGRPAVLGGMALVPGSRSVHAVSLDTGAVSTMGEYGARSMARPTTPLIAAHDRVFLGLDAEGEQRLVSMPVHLHRAPP